MDLQCYNFQEEIHAKYASPEQRTGESKVSPAARQGAALLAQRKEG